MSKIERLFREGTPIDEALRRAVREALAQHKREGHPVVVYRDGKVVLVPPDQIPDSETKKTA